MSFLHRLFGSGRLRIEAVTADGRKATIKTDFAGAWDSEVELLREIADRAFVEEGVKFTRMRVVGAYGRVRADAPVLTGNWFTVKTR